MVLILAAAALRRYTRPRAGWQVVEKAAARAELEEEEAAAAFDFNRLDVEPRSSDDWRTART